MPKFMKYNHPAVPKAGIDIEKIYQLEELEVEFASDYIDDFFKVEGVEETELEDFSLESEEF